MYDKMEYVKSPHRGCDRKRKLLIFCTFDTDRTKCGKGKNGKICNKTVAAAGAVALTINKS